MSFRDELLNQTQFLRLPPPTLSAHSRRTFLQAGAAAVIGTGCLGSTLSALHAADAMKHYASLADEATGHNMLIVGQQTVFLSHLPMFSGKGFVSPHRYQVLLEAAFTKPAGNPQATYFADRKKNPKTNIYTLGPEEFVLPRFAASSDPLRTFRADVFRGHLERSGNRRLAAQVDVQVKRVIHFREFTPQEPATRLEYLLFGKGSEIFLAHFISAPPDFDQVISVSVSDHKFTDEELGQGMRLVFERPNKSAQRLKETQTVVGAVRGGSASASPVKMTVKVLREFYLEEGELRGS